MLWVGVDYVINKTLFILKMVIFLIDYFYPVTIWTDKQTWVFILSIDYVGEI